MKEGLKFLIVFLPHSFRGSEAERILKPQSPLYLLELVDDEIRSAEDTAGVKRSTVLI